MAAREVTEIAFEGNEHFSDGALGNAIVSRETECRSPILFPFCLAGFDFALNSSHLVEREFRRDLARVKLFYYRMGYREAVVDTVLERPSDDEVKITFEIQEGRPVRITELGFTGLDRLPDSSVLQGLPLEVEDPLSLVRWEATEDTLVNRLKNLGYAHAEVFKGYTIPRETPYEARATFELYPGPLAYVGPLTITGHSTVDEGTVRRLLPFQEGDLYAQDLRFAGQRNLYNLEIFSFVDITPELDHQPDSIVPMSIQVAEGDLHRVRTGAGLSTADCISTEALWASRNYLGGARRLQFRGRLSNIMAPQLQSTLCRSAGTGDYGLLNWLISADFNQPWLFSPRTSLSTSFFWERQSFPDIFIRQTRGLNLAVTRTLGVSTRLTLSLTPQISSLQAAEIFFCSNYLVCTPEDIETLQGDNWLSPVGMSLSRDRRNQALSPTRGYSALLDLEYASRLTGSEYRYTRLLADAAWYHQGEGGWVLATRLRGGWVVPGGFRGITGEGSSGEIVHPDKRLYAGGSNSVRGFAQNRLGPQVLQLDAVGKLLSTAGPGGNPVCTPEEILDRSCDAGLLSEDDFRPRPTGGTSLVEGSVEFRIPMAGELWEGATFADFGQVWGEGSDPTLSSIEITPGVGVRYFSPIGPIRVDLAYRWGGEGRLQVVTSGIEPWVQGEGARLEDPEGNELDWMASKDLAILEPRVLWGDYDGWSLRRFQLQISIGQAF